MSTGGLFLFLAFLVMVGSFVLWPFISGRKSRAPRKPTELEQLRAEQNAVLAAIRDVDFDYQTGKLLEADYTTQRETLVERGVSLLKRIDALESGTTPRS